jgi:hypothetical protein
MQSVHASVDGVMEFGIFFLKKKIFFFLISSFTQATGLLTLRKDHAGLKSRRRSMFEKFVELHLHPSFRDGCEK